jgi:hypothetical protein
MHPESKRASGRQSVSPQTDQLCEALALCYLVCGGDQSEHSEIIFMDEEFHFRREIAIVIYFQSYKDTNIYTMQYLDNVAFIYIA